MVHSFHADITLKVTETVLELQLTDSMQLVTFCKTRSVQLLVVYSATVMMVLNKGVLY